ncbi:hypothetical protein TDB9533_01585 [Thalassocella blandensis]|nr:hypothetical protein TDB9533_01585 [Thalassocella blandensis]
MASTLSPSYAADLASNVYLIKDEFSRKGFMMQYKDDFAMDSSTMSKGKTGAFMVVKKAHVMAFMAQGKEKGKFEKQAVIAIKGTASLYDALTDLNAGVRHCHSGFPVHQGFFYAFQSILHDLRKFVSSLDGVTTIHCVGHSLGGALATLAADWLKLNAGAAVKLYTFGSPRVGLQMFASACTSNLKPNNVYRVYHKTDPVPLVPTWPFYHVPYEGIDYLAYSPLSGKPWEYHFMKHYMTTAQKAGSWSALAKNRPSTYLEASLQRWLKSDTAVSLTANTLDLLNAALLYVIKKAMQLTGIVIVTAFASTFTLLDRMAMLLAKAVEITGDFSMWVYHLVKKMAAMIGIKVKEGANLTVSFIRAVFTRLHQRIADMIWQIGRDLK